MILGGSGGTIIREWAIMCIRRSVNKDRPGECRQPERKSSSESSEL